ncbi:hypothetical protein FHG87_022955 [Trinorchestia longiramus]|nr:hypothetical protein FHG87_022955 [Trinorchestia longiramus]
MTRTVPLEKDTGPGGPGSPLPPLSPGSPASPLDPGSPCSRSLGPNWPDGSLFSLEAHKAWHPWLPRLSFREGNLDLL